MNIFHYKEPAKIFFCYEKIMIRVKFPEFTINNIEMLIGEIVSHFVYIVFIANHCQSCKQITLLKISPIYPSCISPVNSEKDSINHSFS